MQKKGPAQPYQKYPLKAYFQLKHAKFGIIQDQYWAIYYSPKQVNVMGGEAWVFIDRSSGNVILHFYMK